MKIINFFSQLVKRKFWLLIVLLTISSILLFVYNSYSAIKNAKLTNDLIITINHKYGNDGFKIFFKTTKNEVFESIKDGKTWKADRQLYLKNVYFSCSKGFYEKLENVEIKAGPFTNLITKDFIEKNWKIVSFKNMQNGFLFYEMSGITLGKKSSFNLFKEATNWQGDDAVFKRLVFPVLFLYFIVVILLVIFKFNFRKETKIISLFFLFSRFLILSIAFLSSSRILMNKLRFFDIYEMFGLFVKWDSEWYLRIVHEGYSYIAGHASSVAFFPLYPLLVKISSYIFFDPVIAGTIISNIFLLIASVFLYKLLSFYYETEISLKAILLLLVSPVTFFYSIIYTESLFLMLIVLAFYFASQKKWFLAGLMGILLSLTKTLGVLIIIPLLIEYFSINYNNLKINFKDIKKNIIFIFMIPIGLFSYMFFQYIKFGEPFAFSKTSIFWDRKFSLITTTLLNITKWDLFYRVIFLFSIIITLFFVIYLFYKKIRFSFAVFSAVLLFFYLSSNILESIPRYLSSIFPVYLGMAMIAEENKYVEMCFYIFSACFLTLFTILFVNGYHFT
jgi:Gpi18-like mannosyltransferase